MFVFYQEVKVVKKLRTKQKDLKVILVGLCYLLSFSLNSRLFGNKNERIHFYCIRIDLSLQKISGIWAYYLSKLDDCNVPFALFL